MRPPVPYLPWTMMPNMMVMGAVADKLGLPNSPEGEPSAPLPLRAVNGLARLAAGNDNPYLQMMREAQVPQEQPTRMSAAERVAMLEDVEQAKVNAQIERESATMAPVVESEDDAEDALAEVKAAIKEQSAFKKDVNNHVRKADKGGKDMGTARDDGGVDYTIAKGDTLTGIAKKFGVSLSDLAAANGISRGNMNFIRAGDKLVIPGMPKEEPKAQAAEALQPAPLAQRGESLLAQKLRAANQPQSFMDIVRTLAGGFSNNPDNVATAETAGAYLGAAASMNPFARAVQAAQSARAAQAARQAPYARIEPDVVGAATRSRPIHTRVDPDLRQLWNQVQQRYAR